MIRGVISSIVYQCVSEKVAVRLQYMRSRRFVLGMRFAASARGRPRWA